MTSCFEVYDARFNFMMQGNSWLECLHTGMLWAEGPVYFAQGDYLLWSDIPNNRIMRYVEGLGVRVWRHPCNNTNGHTRDREGRLVSCEHLGRRVSRTEPDGSITVLADRYEGKRLNSPNDVVVKSDGSIWFTDPAYGIDADYEGDAAPERDRRLLCLSHRPATARSPSSRPIWSSPTASPSRPTRSMLYVADTGASHEENGPRHIRSLRRRRRRPSADRRRGVRRIAPPACSTASASTPRAMSGPAPATACTVYAPDGDAARQDQGSRDRRQRLLRRPQAQPPLHLRDDVRSMPSIWRYRGHSGRKGGRPITRTARCNSKSMTVCPRIAIEQTLIGRAWVVHPMAGPAVVAVRGDDVFDISATSATVSGLLERYDAAMLTRSAPGKRIGSLAELLANSVEETRNPDRPFLLAPCDLQVIKAAGVTFAVSLIERLIEEARAATGCRPGGPRTSSSRSSAPTCAPSCRDRTGRSAQDDADRRRACGRNISRSAIGPDAEVFTKAPVLASVGTGADVGLHPKSTWNNPEPERVGDRHAAAEPSAPRSATTSTCATSRGAARCCSARPRTTTPPARSARSSACSTALRLDDVRPPRSRSRSRARTGSACRARAR